jgi:hypothetical protein
MLYENKGMAMMKISIISATFICIILASIGLSTADSKLSYSENPDSLNREIKSRGASIVVQELYDYNATWQAVLSEIAKGGEAWLKIAILLHNASDAGASEMLTLAVGEALEHNPEAVLKIGVKTFGVRYICGGPDVDDPRYDSYKLAIKAINLRIDRVKAIHDPTLRNTAEKCISALQESKKGIASFYGITKE